MNVRSIKEEKIIVKLFGWIQMIITIKGLTYQVMIALNQINFITKFSQFILMFYKFLSLKWLSLT
jgi:hypothetical protein